MTRCTDATRRPNSPEDIIRKMAGDSDTGIAPWLALEQFDYAPLSQNRAVVRLVAALHGHLGAPSGTTLVLARGALQSPHPVLANALSRRHVDDPASGLLWQASFAVPLDLVEYPRTLFALVARDRLALALPAPRRLIAPAGSSARRCGRSFGGARIKRHLVALGTGVVLATTCVATGSALAATQQPITQTAPQGLRQKGCGPPPARPKDGPNQCLSRDPSQGVIHHQGAHPGPGSDHGNGSHSGKVSDHGNGSHSGKVSDHGKWLANGTGANHGMSPSQLNGSPHRGGSDHSKGADHSKTDQHGSDSSTRRKPRSMPTQHAETKPPAQQTAAHHRASTTPTVPVDKDDLPQTTPPSAPVAPAAPSGMSRWAAGLDTGSFTAAELRSLSSLVANATQPPPYLIPIYKAAGRRYHVPWRILAAINSIETNYGRDLGVSPAGAVGWMQFMPGTWLMYGVDVDGKGRPNPYDPRDAIFSAARYLAASGARHDLRRAIYAYNHAFWYVDAVIWRARTIHAHAFATRHLKGYTLPLDARYMRRLGRTDDGVDIETAPNGAAVYSMTPGVVTAVASDPSGFGPDYPVIRATSGALAGRFVYYGHVAASLVTVGQHVAAGQPIAIIGHTGDAAGLGHGHIEIGFSDRWGDPLDHHGSEAWTPAGAAMRQVLVDLSSAFGITTS